MLLLATLVKLIESPKRKDKIERLVGERKGVNRSGRNKRRPVGREWPIYTLYYMYIGRCHGQHILYAHRKMP